MDTDRDTKRFRRFVVTEELAKTMGGDTVGTIYLPADTEAERIYVTISTKKPEGFKKKLPAIKS